MQDPIQAASPGAVTQVAGNRFVINLMTSTTPVALTQPNHPELKRFSFYVTRRKQDHRERFRLHMGYFSSQSEAEQMLDAVREIFPSAWAGIAPGRSDQKPSGVLRPIAAAALDVAHIAVDFEPPQPLPVPKAKTPEITVEKVAATKSLESVRAAIAALDDAEPMVDEFEAPAPQARRTPPPVPKPPATKVPPAADKQLKTARLTTAEELRLLSDSQVLQVLQQTPKPELPQPTAEAATDGFAVQLKWSVLAIDVTQLPYLAIFESYTLYMAEGARDGRRWYGLRLGFFRDSASAQQVAQYLRSEFTAVSVVPVSVGERDRAMLATAATKAKLPSAEPRPKRQQEVKDYELISEPTPLTPKAELSILESAAGAAKTAAAAAPTDSTATENTRVPPSTLEETMEVLGAGTVTLQSGKGELLSNSAVRSLRHAADRKTPQQSALSRLFNRLGERLGS